MSDLRSLPFIVLLGEPGIGKSTVLQLEASNENCVVRTVRQLMTGTATEPGAPLFLDALDECRVDGSSTDKAYSLGHLMRQARPSRWRLTCRSEDWRKEADIAAIREAADGREIVVAQLLPLSHYEAVCVLESLGAKEPDRFLARAYSLGAQALVESPLSLKLLHAAVKDGTEWPTNRYELFTSAIQRLAHEFNVIHKGGLRQSVPRIIGAAERTCLLLLLTGHRALWRSHDEPPAGGDQRAYLRGYELGLDEALFRDMLDTSLFRGEGESFEPMHRTVAEYLAGRALANSVSGGANSAAFPLARALAMVTGADKKAPTELRGLYAWLAAHLAKLNMQDAARQLVEADASTVLAYGDAAIFPTPLRRAIFHQLDRDDPYFRSGHHLHDTAVGGLAGEDLAEDFAKVLDEPSDGTHRLVTVFEALSTGRSIESLRPRLWNIALDPGRPEWQRERAADAWLNGRQEHARKLFDALTATPPSRERESLRIHIANMLPADTWSIDDIKSLIGDFARTTRDNTVGRLVTLTHSLGSIPRGTLFDLPVSSWIPPDRLQDHSIELEDFFDGMLASAIQKTPNLTAAEVWRWTCNVRQGRWDSLHEKSRKALHSWLDEDPTRATALIDLIIADEDARDAPWIAPNNFIALTGRSPSLVLVRHTLAVAAQTPGVEESKARFAVAVEMALRSADDTAYQETLAQVAARSDCADLVLRLSASRNETLSPTAAQKQAERQAREAQQKANNIQVLKPLIEDLRVGRYSGHLKWAAEQYFSSADPEGRVGIQRIIHFTDEVIAEAFLAGWQYIVTKDFVGVDARMLGQAVGTNQTYHLEHAALAGLDQLFMSQNPLPILSMPIEVAIAVLKSSWMLHDHAKRRQMEGWAFGRINADPVHGCATLLQFWTEAIDSGATHIESLGRVREADAGGAAVAEALHSLLASRRSMPATLLRTALRAASERIDGKRLLILAEGALADSAVSGEARRAWLAVAFALDPSAQSPRLLEDEAIAKNGQFYEELRSIELAAIKPIEPTSRAQYDATIISVAGRGQQPDDEHLWPEKASGPAYLVRGAIQRIAHYPEIHAGRAIQSLIAIPELAGWRRHLQHAYAQWAQLYRESTYSYPTTDAILGALSGGPPVNAADLQAVVMEELNRLRRDLRNSDNTPWKRYWNTDSYGEVVAPRIENQCRDHLLDRLRDRLERYKITAALPESRRAEETRVDILVLTAGGKSLPVEIKRHYHPKLWEAPATQLRGYAQNEGSDGYGIYVVFWFGLDVARLAGRADGKQLPSTATQLEDLLSADMSTAAQEHLQVIVFDVSKEAAEKNTS